MNGKRLKALILALVVVAVTALVTYMVVLASPEVMEPGPRSTAHQGIDCMRCHEAYSGVSDELCLDCHSEVQDLEWHDGARGNAECSECHYEHVGRDWITDLTKVPPHPERNITLNAQHDPVLCDGCHWTATVQPECGYCHERFIEGTHLVGFTDDCQLCHVQSDWDVEYDHDAETAECLDCHGDSPDHTYPGYLEFSKECDDCHEVYEWLIPEFDHEGVEAPCESCHPMSLDVEWSARSGNCSDCHLDTSWTPQVVNHTRFSAPCVQCHGEDRPAEHLDDSEMKPLECDACHVAGTSWDRQVDHENHTRACYQCHGDASVLHDGPYAFDCQWCHVTDARYILQPHPEQTAECTLCHTPEHLGGDPERSVDAAHATQCAACHVAGSDWLVQDIDHDALGLDCYGCHEATHGDIGGWLVACGACHRTEYWVPQEVDHDRFSEDCVSCHPTIHPNGKERYSDQCTLCHGTDDWAVLTWDHDLAISEGIMCVNCHDDIHRGTLGLICEDCHTTDTWETDVINP